ncbi:hypothetical protein ACHAXT_004703 [Thalassiosira profunda]
MSNDDLLSRIIFRAVQPTDIPRCHQIEAASYPEDEAASKATLQYRQHHAAVFFRCAFLVGGGPNPATGSPGGATLTGTSSSISYQGQSVNPAATLRGTIIGFVCATRCKALTAEAMKVHDPSGKILAIHSVVVEERYRNCGVASAMLQDYVSAMERLNSKGSLKVKMGKIVLIAKKHMLAFYVRNGFMATKISPVVHGKEQWFELERPFPQSREGAKSHESWIVDSFADVEKQGSGNPAGVVLLDGPPGVDSSDAPIQKSSESDSDASLDEMDEGGDDDNGAQHLGRSFMAMVAKEFNQSETAFVWPLPNKSSMDNGRMGQQKQNTNHPAYAIRYYTRTGVEVDLCGHATLAAASALLLPKKLEDPKQNHKIAFFAKNDDLQAELLAPPANCQSNVPASISNRSTRIAMNFPWKNVTTVEKEAHEEVLGIIEAAVASVAGHVVHIGTTDGKEDLLIELTEEGFDSLLGKTVDYSALTAWAGYSRGVIICCCASAQTSDSTQHQNPSVDFRSRFFGPKVGIDEDPVTGSAHCSLGPYFGSKLGKTTLVGRQESERGGLVECILKAEEGRVCIVGTAVTVLSGKLHVSW